MSTVRRAVAEFEATESLFGYQQLATRVAVSCRSEASLASVFGLCVLFFLIKWGDETDGKESNGTSTKVQGLN